MRAHVVYLAIIAVLVLIIVYAAARAVRAGRVVAELEARFGLKGRASLPRPGARAGEGLRRLAGAELLRPRAYAEYRAEVDGLVARALELEEFGAGTRLAAACAEALAGGKRLRGVIVLEVARATSALRAREHAEGGRRGRAPTPVDAAEAALSLEYVHAASLIIDDHPDFDNDAVRRGRPALHVAAGPAVAQMAAVALLAAALQNVCRQADWIREHCPEAGEPGRLAALLCSEASRALGVPGAAGGQYMDVSSAADLRREYGPDAVQELIARKTASFFELACVAGWLAAGGAPEEAEALRAAGRHVGTAFQLADDLGDAASDAARAAAGKPGWNFANEYGRDVAAGELERHLNGARYLLAQRGLWSPLWEGELFPMVRAMAAPAPAPAAESSSAGKEGEPPG
jgi:geranylgeranyl diphosphate synthase type II